MMRLLQVLSVPFLLEDSRAAQIFWKRCQAIEIILEDKVHGKFSKSMTSSFSTPFNACMILNLRKNCMTLAFLSPVC